MQNKGRVQDFVPSQQRNDNLGSSSIIGCNKCFETELQVCLGTWLKESYLRIRSVSKSKTDGFLM